MRHFPAQRVLLCAVVAFFFSSIAANAVFLGDINQDDDIDLQDAILGLQVITGNSPTIPQVVSGIDVDQNGRIGLAEVIYILQAVKKNDTPLQHQAKIVGPLSGTAISAFRADSMSRRVEGVIKANTSADDLLVAGSFDLMLSGIDDDEWIVVAARGGADIDYNGDSIPDTSATLNNGQIHALAKASDWRTGQVLITPLTELAYQFSKNLFSQVPRAELSIHLQDIARKLIKTDIDGNGSIDWNDILMFDPANSAHRTMLITDYGWLSTPDDDGNSIIDAILADNGEQMLSCMDETYSYLMTRFPVPDSRYHSARVTLSVFGRGSASSNVPASLTVDSTLPEPLYEDHIYLPENEATIVTFTATSASDTSILSWSGCETVSADLSQCTVTLDQSRYVVANFGRDTVELNGVLHDLRSTNNTITLSSVSVLIPDDMADMITEMAAAAVGDFIVGDDNGGFLRRITGIDQISSTSYQLTTVEASLDEVIKEGTGQLFKQMTNGDLEGYTPASPSGSSAKVAPKAFTGRKGVQLVLSDSPDDTTFTLSIGQTDSQTSMGKHTETGSLVLLDDGEGNTLTATGSISLDISLDTAFDYKMFDGLQAFKFIVIVDAEEEVDLTASNDLIKFPTVKEKLGTFRFTPITFVVGAVPVWVTPTVDVFFYAKGGVSAEVSFGVKFEQRVEGGILYNKNTGFSSHKLFSSNRTFNQPTAKITASIKGGVEVSPSLKIYDATGPALPQKIYAKMTASVSTEVFGTCSDIVLKNKIGFESDFKWDLSGSTKLGQMLHLDQLEEMTRFNIFSHEWTYSEEVLYDNCPAYGSHLIVDGEGIFEIIDVGDANGLVTTLTVKNDGGETLHWNTSGIPSGVLVSPNSGELAPGAQELVQMSLSGASLPAGRFRKEIYFYNEASTGSALPDEQFGNTWKIVDVNVLGQITDIPVLLQPTSPSVGRVVLNWDFSSTGDDPFVGFQIFTTRTPEDPQTYQHIYTTDIYTRSATISGFTPGAGYSFDLRAYSNSGQPGPYSNKMSVTVAGTPPIVASSLNDTGLNWGGNYSSGNNPGCTGVEIGAQDCSHGRDVTHNDDSDGHAGFSFTKISSTGQELAASAASWSCVKDNVTGLMWEVKTDDDGLHDKDDLYNWYNTDPTTNGGEDGYADDDGDICHGYNVGDSSTYCNTQAFTARVNGAGLCGASDWGMPTRNELLGIVSFDRYNPSIDSNYFPNTPASSFLSGSAFAGDSNNAWHVYFYDGSSSSGYRSASYSVRLVRGGQ